MRDFSSCFGEKGVQVADSSSSSSVTKPAQNLVTCAYECRLRNRSSIVTITWNKSLVGHGFSVAIGNSSNQSQCKIEIKPWLFSKSKRKGFKSLEGVDFSGELDLYWDLSSAKYAGSNPQPFEGFYLSIVFDRQIVLLLGDLRKEALKKTNATYNPVHSNGKLVAKRENLYGKNTFTTKAQFCDNGKIHDVIIECDLIGISESSLVVRVDSKPVMKTKRLRWKFRGNHTILVDGVAIDFFWDVHNWFFDTSSSGNAFFMFRTRVAEEKLWAGQHLSSSITKTWSQSQRFGDDLPEQSLGFSLILYAWRTERKDCQGYEASVGCAKWNRIADRMDQPRPWC